MSIFFQWENQHESIAHDRFKIGFQNIGVMSPRCLIVTQTYRTDQGSYATWVTELARYATEQGYQVTILTGAERGEDAQETTSFGTIHRLILPRPLLFRSIIKSVFLRNKVKRFLKDWNWKQDDIIIANGDGAWGLQHVPFIVRAPDQPAQVLADQLACLPQRYPLLSAIARKVQQVAAHRIMTRTLANARAAIYSSHESKKLFEKYHRKLPSSSFIPRSAVPWITNDHQEYRQQKILFVGGSQTELPRKGAHIFKAAIQELATSQHLDITIVGHPVFTAGELSTLNATVRQLGIVPWSSMQQVYAECNVLIVASLSEGFPNVILEGMGMGLAIVTSDITGVREFITDGVDGYVFERNSVSSLVEKLNMLFAHPRKIQEFGSHARARARELTYDNYFHQFFSFVKKIQDHSIAMNVIPVASQKKRK